MAEFDLNDPINWEEIEHFEGEVPDLNYALMWDASDEDEDEDRTDAGESDVDEDITNSNMAPTNGTENASGQGVNIRRRNNYSDDTKRAIYSMLLERTTIGTLKHGVTTSVSIDTGVPLRVVQRIWKKGQLGGGVHAVCNKRPGNCGRKRIVFNSEAIRDVPLRNRSTIRDLASSLNVSKSTLFRRLKEGKFRRHTNDIKFSLTDDNKQSRVRFCISMLHRESIHREPTFRGAYDIVYIDEKWFYMTRKSKSYYLALDEERPQRTVRSKNFIEKVMFLAAITRPRFDAHGNETFSGKIGIFPFTYVEPAKRTSANRPAGSFEV